MSVEQDVTMPVAPARVRQLTREDAAMFRDIRLAALHHTPEAFCASHDVEAAQPLDWFASRLERSAVFGAFRAATLVGIAGLLINDAGLPQQRGVLWGMYVADAEQGRGIGRDLIRAVIDHARTLVPELRLGVIAGNASARGLYRKLGFVETGTEARVLAESGRAITEVTMSLRLAVDGGTGAA